MPTLIHFVRKVALYVSTAAVNSWLVEWQHGYCDEQKEGFGRRRKLSSEVGSRKWLKRGKILRVSGILTCKFYTQTIWENRTEIISAFERSGSRKKAILKAWTKWRH